MWCTISRHYDHAPPHLHFRSPESDGRVEIATLMVMRGDYDRRELAVVLKWMKGRQRLLMRKWNDLNEGS